MAWDNNQSNSETPMNISGSPTSHQRQEPIAYSSFHTPYKVDQYLNQSSQSHKQFDNRYLSIQAVEQQLAVILKLPSLSQRCIDISNLLKERFASNMSRNIMGQLFKPIVDNIFGYDIITTSNEDRQKPHSDWILKTLTRTSNANDYDSVISFLHPDGIFFAFIKSLMTETSSKYEFPVSQFPPHFKSMIENGTAPTFFANKIISTSYISASHLILSAFEFYIFHFGLYILNNSSSTYDASTAMNNEPAYFTLLKIYLNHFVPLENAPRTNENTNFSGIPNNQQNSLWQSLSSTTTSIFNLATNTNSSSTNVNNQGNNILPSLFRASIFQPQTPFNQNLNNNYPSTPGPIIYGQGENLGSLEWRCSTFFLVLTELWFGNIPTPKTIHALASTDQSYSPNIDQMTSVRIVIKHLHSFSNSFTYNPVGHVNSQGLAEIKQAIWTSKYPLQKRLYTFIKVAINRWRMDYTYRQPLEAWLSYIQPWRYVKMNTSVSNDFEDFDANRNTSLLDVPSIDNHWRNFMSNNLLYYMEIFNLLIDRLLELDLSSRSGLSSSRNALMLFRVIKVYSQTGFLSLLKDAEEAVMRNNLEQNINMNTSKTPYKTTPGKTNDPNSSKAKLLAPSFLASGRVSTPKTRIGALEHHLINLESDSDFHYVSIFSPQTKRQLAKLLVEVQKSRVSIKDFIQTVEVRSKLRNKGWLDSFRSFLSMEDICFESKDEKEMYKDKIQAEEYLNFATNKIIQCFEIQMPDIDLTQVSSTSNLTNIQNSGIFFR